ncbi:MAG: acetylxylan esterase, partial [Kiritimatiellia bacterium]|nr:acetylxylan esterase [Kiritimatiellia bacterium]
HWAGQGVLALRMNVHAYDPPTDPQALLLVYSNLNETATYNRHGAPDREAYYYRKSILGIDRAIQWMASRPDWDGKHLVVTGSSQGGGFSLILAGFSPLVTAAGAHVPALCDHAAYQAERSSGWPNLVQGIGQGAEEYLVFSRYYDAVNFARRIRVPTAVSVGFIDRTCSPGSVYAAYNQIEAPKKIWNGPLMPHSPSREMQQRMDAWLKEQLGIHER